MPTTGTGASTCTGTGANMHILGSNFNLETHTTHATIPASLLSFFSAAAMPSGRVKKSTNRPLPLASIPLCTASLSPVAASRASSSLCLIPSRRDMASLSSAGVQTGLSPLDLAQRTASNAPICSHTSASESSTYALQIWSPFRHANIGPVLACAAGEPLAQHCVGLRGSTMH